MTIPLKRNGMLSLLSWVISKAASCCVLGMRTCVEPGQRNALAATPRLRMRPRRPMTRYSLGFALTNGMEGLLIYFAGHDVDTGRRGRRLIKGDSRGTKFSPEFWKVRGNAFSERLGVSPPV